MPKYRVMTTVNDYWDVIVEAADEQEARDRGLIDFDNSLNLLVADIEVYPVSDETELGDASP